MTTGPAYESDRHAGNEVALGPKDGTEQYLRAHGMLTGEAGAAYRWNMRTNRYDYTSAMFGQVANLGAEDVAALDLDTVLSRIHADDRLRVGARIEAILGGGDAVIEYRFRGQDGEYRWLADRTRMLLDAQDRPTYRVGVIQDITNQKTATEAALAVPDSASPIRTTPVRVSRSATPVGWLIGVAATILVAMAGAGMYRISHPIPASVESFTQRASTAPVFSAEPFQVSEAAARSARIAKHPPVPARRTHRVAAALYRTVPPTAPAIQPRIVNAAVPAPAPTPQTTTLRIPRTVVQPIAPDPPYAR